jgi:phage-related protein
MRPAKGVAKGDTEYRVRVCRPAFCAAHRMFNSVQDWMELRANALKLRWWPRGRMKNKVIDLDWDWIRALPDLNVGELRVDDRIGGFDNIRVIFFKADIVDKDHPPTIWVLHVMQKKRQEFTQNDIRVFKARRMLVMEYSYRSATAGGK